MVKKLALIVLAGAIILWILSLLPKSIFQNNTHEISEYYEWSPSLPPANPLPTNYISYQDAPPVLVKKEGNAECPVALQSIGSALYCVQATSEGAAGSIYTNYIFSRYYAEKDTTLAISFTTRATQCANYNEPQKTACETERETFDVNNYADSLFAWIQWL